MFRRRILIPASLTIAVLISVELVMRLTGALLQAPTDQMNHVDPGDASKLRILAIGESTTADFFSPKEAGAWPRQLEHFLRDANVDARVYNEGIAGTTSGMILSRVPEYIEKYHPQIVISMMGVNDTSYIRFDGSVSSRLALFLSQIRVLKLAHWLYDSLEARTKCRLDFKRTDGMLYYRTVSASPVIPVTATVAEAEKTIRFRWPWISNLDLALILTEYARIMDGPINPGQGHDKFLPFYRRAFELAPYNYFTSSKALTAEMWNRYTNPENERRALALSWTVLKCSNVPDDMLSMIAQLVDRHPEIADAPVFASRGFSVSNRPGLPTAFHYQQLHELLKNAGITHIAMQYPTLPIDQVKKYLDNASDVTYVSNQENFEQALKSHNYEDIFQDRFKGSWGHTTLLGHRMIAENLLQEILKHANP